MERCENNDCRDHLGDSDAWCDTCRANKQFDVDVLLHAAMASMTKPQTPERRRAETGVMVFERDNGSEDWPGVFIRGDSAITYAMEIDSFLKFGAVGAFPRLALVRLEKLLRSCYSGGTPETIQKAKLI